MKVEGEHEAEKNGKREEIGIIMETRRREELE